MISMNDYVEEISKKFVDAQNFLYLGRGKLKPKYNFHPCSFRGSFEAERDFLHTC